MMILDILDIHTIVAGYFHVCMINSLHLTDCISNTQNFHEKLLTLLYIHILRSLFSKVGVLQGASSVSYCRTFEDPGRVGYSTARFLVA